MKDNNMALYPNEEVARKVFDYAATHSTKLPQHIWDHYAWGVGNQPSSNYMISPLQAQFLIFLVKSVGAKRILEIGTYIGFSALGWAEAVGQDGHVTTLEFSEKYAAIARDAFSTNKIENVDVVVGDANITLQKMTGKSVNIEPFDLIFVDADKVSYPNYLANILEGSKPSSQHRLLKPGGLIIADNILRNGLVADRSASNPLSAEAETGSFTAAGLACENKEEYVAILDALDKFNKEIVANERLESFLLPLFDGLGMARLKD